MSDDHQFSAAEQSLADSLGLQLDDLNAVGLGGFDHTPGWKQPTNLARLMRDGAPPPPMLLDEWLVQGELHWVYADAESAKTWLALIWAHEVMRTLNHRVVWFDEELGERVMTERLLALGASPETVESHFAYFQYPSWQMSHEESDAHAELLRLTQPALVVYDTATDALAEAGLNENDGTDITRWVKAYPERARQLGVTQIVLDHTTKEGTFGSRHAVGSRAKRAKAKVQYAMEMVDPFSREEVGAVRVRLTKNTRGADIARDRVFKVGGGSGETGAFVWEQQLWDGHNVRSAAKQQDFEETIAAKIKQHGTLSQTQLEKLVPGNARSIRETAKLMAHVGVHGFVSEPGPRNAIMYRWTRDDPAGSDD